VMHEVQADTMPGDYSSSHRGNSDHTTTARSHTLAILQSADQAPLSPISILQPQNTIHMSHLQASLECCDQRISVILQPRRYQASQPKAMWYRPAPTGRAGLQDSYGEIDNPLVPPLRRERPLNEPTSAGPFDTYAAQRCPYLRPPQLTTFREPRPCIGVMKSGC